MLLARSSWLTYVFNLLRGTSIVTDININQPLEIFVDDETKLTLHGLQQHYVKMEEAGKNRKLNELLDNLEFNQVRFNPP